MQPLQPPVAVYQLLLANPVLGCEPFDPFTSPGLGSTQGVFVLLIDKCGAVLQLPTQVKLLSLQQATRQREKSKQISNKNSWLVRGPNTKFDGSLSSAEQGVGVGRNDSEVC